MNISTAIEVLNTKLLDQKPKILNPAWIRRHARSTHRWVSAHIRRCDGHVDWDTFTRKLPWDFQQRWKKGKRSFREYEGREEVQRLLKRHEEKLYVFITPLDEEDKQIRDTISIALVRMAQCGNITARQEVHHRVKDTVDLWKELDKRLMRWRGYEELIPEQIEACIRRYRYSGTFIGYLYRTLECVGHGLRPLEAFSLDEELPSGKKRKGDSLAQDPQSGEIRLY